MTRTTVVALLAAITPGARFVEAQEPPALAPPLEAPAASATESPSGIPPEPPTVERPRPTEPSPPRPLLVIPGVTAPPSRRPPRMPVAESPAPANAAPLALDAPVVEPDIHLRLEPIRDRSSATAATADRGSSSGRDSARPAREEDRDDPAVEAAVKRRVEKQVEEAVGNRVADVRIRVSGRSVAIRARATRFWYRWWARRELESLAMPEGYRARVVVD